MSFVGWKTKKSGIFFIDIDSLQCVEPIFCRCMIGVIQRRFGQLLWYNHWPSASKYLYWIKCQHFSASINHSHIQCNQHINISINPSKQTETKMLKPVWTWSDRWTLRTLATWTRWTSAVETWTDQMGEEHMRWDQRDCSVLYRHALSANTKKEIYAINKY